MTMKQIKNKTNKIRIKSIKQLIQLLPGFKENYKEILSM